MLCRDLVCLSFSLKRIFPAHPGPFCWRSFVIWLCLGWLIQLTITCSAFVRNYYAGPSWKLLSLSSSFHFYLLFFGGGHYPIILGRISLVNKGIFGLQGISFQYGPFVFKKYEIVCDQFLDQTLAVDNSRRREERTQGRIVSISA